MKFPGLVASVAILGIVAACASTKVTERNQQAGGELLPRPDLIYVYPFAATQEDIPSWTAASSRYAEPSKPSTPEELATGRELGEKVAQELIAEISGMGLAAAMGSPTASPNANDIMITGYFEAIEKGSAAERVVLGFGAGSAELKTVVEGYQMTSAGPRLLGSGTLESGGSKTPGAIVPLVVLAATANPVGLVVAGTAKVAGEAMGKDTIEGAAKRTAKEISKELRVKFEEQGWIE